MANKQIIAVAALHIVLGLRAPETPAGWFASLFFFSIRVMTNRWLLQLMAEMKGRNPRRPGGAVPH